MNRKSYYIHYYDPETPMAYHLFYCNDPSERILLPEGARRITYDNAKRLVISEKLSRNRRRPHAGASDTAVFPIAYPGTREQLASDPGYALMDWIWLPVKME